MIIHIQYVSSGKCHVIWQTLACNPSATFGLPPQWIRFSEIARHYPKLLIYSPTTTIQHPFHFIDYRVLVRSGPFELYPTSEAGSTLLVPQSNTWERVFCATATQPSIVTGRWVLNTSTWSAQYIRYLQLFLMSRNFFFEREGEYFRFLLTLEVLTSLFFCLVIMLSA